MPYVSYAVSRVFLNYLPVKNVLILINKVLFESRLKAVSIFPPVKTETA